EWSHDSERQDVLLYEVGRRVERHLGLDERHAAGIDDAGEWRSGALVELLDEFGGEIILHAGLVGQLPDPFLPLKPGPQDRIRLQLASPSLDLMEAGGGLLVVILLLQGEPKVPRPLAVTVIRAVRGSGGVDEQLRVLGAADPVAGELPPDEGHQ